jgi:uncharacterized protein YqeY
VTTHPVDAVKARLRTDIRAAMSAKQMNEARVLRTLLAALDNAEAHPVASGHTPYVEHAFGDKAVEVARKVLTAEDVETVLRTEHEERAAAARVLDQHGKAAEASALKAEAALVARYMRT